MENKNCENKNLSLMARENQEVANQTRNQWQPKNKKLPTKPGTNGNQGQRNNKKIKVNRTGR